MANRVTNDVGLTMQPELAHEVRAMCLRGSRADRQLQGDLLNAVSPGGEAEHLRLARGERLVGLGGGSEGSARVGVDGVD